MSSLQERDTILERFLTNNKYSKKNIDVVASCKKCKEDDNVKADSNYYENTNRHPVWYKHDISTGEMILGPDGKPIVQYNTLLPFREDHHEFQNPENY